MTTIDPLRRIACTRLGLAVVPDGATTPAVATAILAELAHVGLRITNPAAVTDAFAADVPALVTLQLQVRGQHGTYSPLFRGFPEKLPDRDDAQLRFTLAAVRLLALPVRRDVDRDRRTVAVEDLRRALDFSDLGWWPASSVPQDVGQARLDRALQELLPGDPAATQWTDLTLIRPDQLAPRLQAYLADCLTQPASLRADVRDEVTILVGEYGVAHVDPAAVTFAETRTLLARLLWEQGELDQVVALVRGPDDLLRLFADLTDGDVSLASPIRYPRMTRAQRRCVVRALELSPRLNDVYRRRGLWLDVARGLHLGDHDAPRVTAVFTRLRADRRDRTATRSRFERTLDGGDYPTAVTLLAEEAPAVLVRQLRRLAHLAAEGVAHRQSLLDALGKHGDVVPARVLWAAHGQLVDNGATYPRLAFTKAGHALPIDRPAGHLTLPEDYRADLLSVLEGLIDRQASAWGDLGGTTVWIDPVLEGVLMPDQLRSTAQGALQVERGSRLPLGGDEPVLRMFVHWREPEGKRSDLDLSVAALDEDFAVVDFVSWTNLGNDVLTHSGDVVSAPDGAQEFIDVDLARLVAQVDASAPGGPEGRAHGGRGGSRKRWRYLVPTVNRYAGPPFAALPEAVVGWMLREQTSSDRRTFDPATVAAAFALTGRAGIAAPMLVDLHARQVLDVGQYLRAPLRARVERDGDRAGNYVRAAVARADTKASVAAVARRVVTARGGTVVDVRDGATVTFGLGDDCTFDALRPERLLAELL